MSKSLFVLATAVWLLVNPVEPPPEATPAGSYAVTVVGRVLDVDTRQPLSGAQVHIAGSGAGALANAAGRYMITLDDSWVGRSATVVVTHLGHAQGSSTITLADGVNTVDFTLQQQALSLNEIVVTGKPGQTRRREVGNTVTVGVAADASGAPIRVTTAPATVLAGGPLQVMPGRDAYAQIVENEFIAVEHDPLSTFSIDVDRASYSNVRRFITDGVRPPIDAVRIEELVNYFSYSDPEPTGDHPFTVTAEVAPAPWQPQHHLVRVGLKGQSIDMEDAPPNNLVFLLDVSGSMSTPDKLPLLKTAFGMLVEQLRPQDRVAIVVYAGAAGLVLPSTAGSERETIITALEQLQAGGSTAGGAGIRLAYAVAAENHIEGGNNRVILATDGDFNVGASSDSEMVRLIEDKREQGTFLTVLGFGRGNLQDAKMEQIADHGNGNFAYIDGALEARKVLVTEMGGTLVTIAKDVKIQVEFNPAQVASYRLIGYENRLLAAEDFNDDTKDAGELGAGHSVTALYEVVPVGVDSPVRARDVDELRYQDRPETTAMESDELLFVKLRYKDPDGDTSRLITRTVRDIEAEGSEDLRFSAAVAAWGMLLRESEHCSDFSLDDVARMARGSLGEDRGGYRADFLELVDRARSMELLEMTPGSR